MSEWGCERVAPQVTVDPPESGAERRPQSAVPTATAKLAALPATAANGSSAVVALGDEPAEVLHWSQASKGDTTDDVSAVKEDGAEASAEKDSCVKPRGQRLSGASGGDGAYTFVAAVAVSEPATAATLQPRPCWSGFSIPDLAIPDSLFWLGEPQTCRAAAGFIGSEERCDVGQVMVVLHSAGVRFHRCVRVLPGDDAKQILLRAAATLGVAGGSAAIGSLSLAVRRTCCGGALAAPSAGGAFCVEGRVLRGGMRLAAGAVVDPGLRANATLERTKFSLKGCVDRMRELQELVCQVKRDVLAPDSASRRLPAPKQWPSEALHQRHALNPPRYGLVEI